MPSLMPLLSSPSNTLSSAPPVSPKKAPRKLRRKNPPPSLSTNHQKLPSSAGSSTYSLPKSRPSSSKSNHNGTNNGWFSSPPTPHPGLSGGRRKSQPHIGDWSPEEFPPRPPPLPTLGNGIMTPPQSGSPELAHRSSQGLQEQNYSTSMSASSVYTSPPASSKQDHFPIIQQTIIHSPPPNIVRGKGRDTFKAFSYDSYNNMPVSPPPQSPPPNSVPPTYLGTAQYPNNLLQQPPTPRMGHLPRAQTLPTPLITNLAPPTPAQQRLMGRTPNGSPILPPLPSFQSGGFGFDLPNANDRFAQPKASPTYPGRQRYKPATSPLSSPGTPAVLQRRRPTVFIEPETESPILDSPMMESPLVTSPGDYIFHALTAEEPIVLPSSAEQSPEVSPSRTSTEFSQPPTKGRARRKSDAVSSFLGGWKLAMMGGGSSSSTVSNDKAVSNSSDSDAPPVGVGDGGGWIHRRKGSFSSTRPPSRERSKQSAYAQEYKELRAQKASESGSSSKASSKRSSAVSRDGNVPPISPIEGTGVSAILGGLSTRERFGEKMKAVEARQMRRESEGDLVIQPPVPAIEPSQIPAREVVSLDVAVRQMNLLEEQLKKGRPLSPPDSREGEKSDSDKGYHAESEYSLTDAATNSRQNSANSSTQNSGQSSPSGSINQKFQLLPAPRPQLAEQKTAEPTGKGKSRSPLRNEIDSDSVSPTPEQPKSSSRHSGTLVKSDHFGRPKSSGAGLEGGSSSKPATPPKPIAKLFVICCRCKYWHDLPSVMYRGMVENGGATRCPYCLHGMEVACCAGYVHLKFKLEIGQELILGNRYTCVVYMHQKHH